MYRKLPHVFWKLWDTDFQMSYREVCWRQYCPIDRHLKKFLEGQQKCKKTLFLLSANYLRFWYWHTYPGYRHVKAHENVNKFLGVGVFERELLLLKLRRLQNFRSGHNIEFSEPKRIAGV